MYTLLLLQIVNAASVGRKRALTDIRRPLCLHAVHGLLQHHISDLLEQLRAHLHRRSSSSSGHPWGQEVEAAVATAVLAVAVVRSGSADLGGGAIRPHAARVWTLVSVFQSLMVLRWWHRRHRKAVGEAQALRREGGGRMDGWMRCHHKSLPPKHRLRRAALQSP